MSNHFYFILPTLVITKFAMAGDLAAKMAPPAYSEEEADKQNISTMVGSEVIPDDLTGAYVIVAFDKVKSKYLIRDYEGKNRWYSKDQLAVTTGGLQGICVGDQVIPTTLEKGQGKVIGINFTTSKYVVRAGGYIYRHSYEQLVLAPASETCSCALQ